MPALRKILDFLELRPFFTLRTVQVVWWLYIAERLYSTTWFWTQTITARGPLPRSYDWFEMAFRPLRLLITLAMTRLLLDVLLAIVMPSRREWPRESEPLGSALLAFLDLRPFFTRWWLRVFWWLYLLTFLRAIYPYFAFLPPWVFATSPMDWVRFFHSVLIPVIWLMGVRLLIEAALMLQAPASHAPEQSKP